MNLREVKTLLFYLFLCSTQCFSQDATTVFYEDSLRFFLDNGTIKVGFDKRMGGVVSYFERKSNGENLINNHDAGRQAGFESRIYPTNQSTWKPYPNSKYLSDIYPLAGGASREWNGLPQGSFYNQNFAEESHLGGMPEVVSFNADSKILYTKAKLWEWGFINLEDGDYKKIDAGAYNEYWISLSGIAANFTIRQVRNIPYFVSDDNVGSSANVFINMNYKYAEKWQTYNGSNPYTHHPINIRNFSQNNQNYWDLATENWVAVTNNNDFGMGIYMNDRRFTFLYGERQAHPECTVKITPCPDEYKYSFGTFSFSTYSFPCGELCTTPNNSLTLNFSFLAGSITEIRNYALEKRENPCEKGLALASKNDDIHGGTVTLKSQNFIDATNKLHNGNVIYKSDKEILLKAGFHAKEGSVFEAKISNNPCD
jgi:hypothetical protein